MSVPNNNGTAEKRSPLLRVLHTIYWIVFAISLVIVLAFAAFKIFIDKPVVDNPEIVIPPTSSVSPAPGQPGGDQLMALAVGMQPVRAQALAAYGILRLDAAGGVQIQHRQCVVLRHFHQNGAVHMQRMHLILALIVRIHFLIAVERGEDDDGLSDVFFQKALHQHMAGAVEGIHRAVLKRAKRSIAVAKVVGAAEYHHRVGGGVHLFDSGGKPALMRLGGHAALTGDARAADAVVVHGFQFVFTPQNVRIAVGGAGGPHTLGDAVAQHIDHAVFQFHKATSFAAVVSLYLRFEQVSMRRVNTIPVSLCIPAFALYETACFEYNGFIPHKGKEKILMKAFNVNSGFLYGVTAVVIVYVLAQSLFFLVRAAKRARQLGIESSVIKKTILSSGLFSVAPAVAILLGVITLSKFMGLPLPWLRLSILGALTYELPAASTTATAMNLSLSTAITDPKAYSAIAWVMTLGIIPGIFVVLFGLKKIQSGIVSIKSKDPKWGELFMSSMFLGMISAFVGTLFADVRMGVPGFIPIVVALVSAVIMGILGILIKVCKMNWLE